MYQRLITVASLLVSPIAAWGHPGHGEIPSPSPGHYFTDHAAALWIAGGLLAVAVVAWRRLRS